MRVLFFVLLLFAPAVIFAPAAVAAEEYICPMHPHISGKEGDSCPICGMTLVPKVEKTPDNAGHEGHSTDALALEGALHIDPSYVQALGVKTAEVTHRDFGRNIRAFGKIVPSTRLEYAVDVRMKGWIVDLPVDAVGDTVKKGDLLFTYYSPDLMTAQSDYLIGSKIGGAEQRLRLYGMDDKAIAELKKKGRFLEETPFYAPADGSVTLLNVRKGSHVNEGGNIVKLQDFSKLWVNVDVPVKDIQFLAVGTPATVTVPETGDNYETSVDFIHPVNDPQSRTVTVRLILDNPNGVLKPDTFVDAAFRADVQSRLAVPAEAVLYGGMGAYVMENVSDGMFRPVMVETGITADGLTEIKNGLKHGQRIVTSGQFMLDAESNLRGGMAAMGHDHGSADMDGMDMKQPEPAMKGMDHGQH
ncbi:MAG: efflux RND transporter periplasmic adaptor subunit [Rhodospirillales bacterium]|nr:efflux RND transporter periplasmic adaptor subunit [Alphaproteobacteria bacterium]MCB1839875.1 efflux RND transporter periplasmic adaptor subunit [Alphaproteobacteria bacterium]MCB9976639.1 efflux RND transporter periplasmic adaptor subunit [Rhodospirillales bacterium]